MSKVEAILSQLKDIAANPKKAMDDYKAEDRKSTRLNSSHPSISYAVFC